MIPWWLAAAAHGAIVLKTGNICVAFQPSFANAIGDVGAVGTPRPAHGLEFQITDAFESYTGNLLDDSGCLDDYPVFAEDDGGTITLRVWSRARLRGIDMESWEGADHLGPKRFLVAEFTVSTGATTRFSSTSTVVGTDQRWRNLSVAAVEFWEYNWDFRRETRLDPIHLQSDPSARPGSCCRTRLRDTDNVLGNEPVGLLTGTDVPFRFRLVHELRRVLSGINDTLWDCGRRRLFGGVRPSRCSR